MAIDLKIERKYHDYSIYTLNSKWFPISLVCFSSTENVLY